MQNDRFPIDPEDTKIYGVAALKNNLEPILNAVNQDKSIKRFCCPTTSLVAETKIR